MTPLSAAKSMVSGLRWDECPSIKSSNGRLAGACVMNCFLNHELNRLPYIHPFSENP